MKLLDSILVVFFVTSFRLNVHCGLIKGTLNLATKLVASLTESQINDFINFENENNKTYDSPQDEARAIKNFVKNLKFNEAQNKKFKDKKSKFETGTWMHSDIDPQDFMKNFTGYKGKPKFRFVIQNDFPSDNIPEYLNYTEEGIVTRVMYQSMCGSCWAFAALGALEGQLAKKNGYIAKLSEQNLVDCNQNEDYGNWGCDGGSMDAAYEFIRKQGGINAAFNYRYLGKESGKCNYNQYSSYGKLVDYAKIESGNETLLKIALANVGPLAVAIDVSQPTFMNYKSGVYDDPKCTGVPNHAVLLVGYGTDPVYGKYWLIKNSWSSSWGERGYVRIARDQNNLCNIAFDASYPIV